MNNRWITLGLSLLGVGGVGLTSWLSIKCHEKAKDKEDTKEKLIAYAPAIVSGLGTSACILGSHHISNKEIAALTASCAYLASNREKIETKIKEKFGDKKLLEVKKEVGKELTISDSGSRKGICYEKTGKGNVRFLSYDQGRYFLSSLDEVQKADRMINHMCSKGIIPTWNDYYDLLGLQNTRWGEEYIIPDDKWGTGWNMDKPVQFDYIEWNDEEGKECYIIYTVSDLRREF